MTFSQMPRIDLVAFDMDGTLLTSEKIISPRTARALRAVQEKGIPTIIVTGRPIKGVDTYLPLVSRGMPVVALNGAEIYTGDHEALLHRSLLPRESAQQILSFAQANETTIFLWCDGVLYANAINQWAEHYSYINHTWPQVTSAPEALAARGVTSILLCDTVPRVAQMREDYARLADPRVNYYVSNPNYLEIIDRRASKGAGLLRVASALQVDPRHILAFGDEVNDISMVTGVGCGIAMGNGLRELQQAACHIARSNDEDGVALVLEQLLALGKFDADHNG